MTVQKGPRLLFVRTRFNLLYHIQEHGCVVPAEEGSGECVLD
jgi:hypothetical protein